VDRDELHWTLIPKHEKSGTETLVFWLMRGAQPATSAGARPFAGSPIPAFLTTLQRGGEEINLELAVFQLPPDKRFQKSPSRKFTHLSGECVGKLIALRWISSARNISELTLGRLRACLQLKSLD
jgi:hypothetical protein